MRRLPKLWPWKYWGRIHSVGWSFGRNAEGGLSLIVNHHFFYTTRYDGKLGWA